MDLTHLSSQLKLKTDFNAGASLGLRDINSVTGIIDNSITSIQALIFANKNAEYDDLDPTKFDITGITSGYDGQGFIFDIKKEYKYNLSSDITDHYVEDNVAIQDHIGLKPEILEVVGVIAEQSLSDVLRREMNIKNSKFKDSAKNNDEDKKGNAFNSLDSFLYRMGSLTSFAPNIINQAADIYNSASFVYSTTSKMINFNKKSIGKSGFAYTEEYNEEVIKVTKQFNYIDWFKTQWENRASFTIVTPYGVLTDMYILDLNASQPDNTRYITNLSIKFKHIRKAQIIAIPKKVGQKMDVQQTKAVEEKKEDAIPLAQLGHSQTRNNINADVRDDKYTNVKSNSTSTASYNVADGENSISKESLGIMGNSFQDALGSQIRR